MKQDQKTSNHLHNDLDTLFLLFGINCDPVAVSAVALDVSCPWREDH